jgi:hypothetical protein
MESNYICEGGSARSAKGVLAMVNPMEWVDIKVVEASGHHVPWALRYRMARASREVEVGMEGRGGFQVLRREECQGRCVGPPGGGADFLEVVGEAGAEALEALLVERGDAYDVDGEMLVRLADAGVPGKVIDVVVALSYPDRFVLDAGSVEEMQRERAYGDRPMPYAGAYRWSLWNPFFYDPFYSGYGAYGYGGYGYSPTPSGTTEASIVPPR